MTDTATGHGHGHGHANDGHSPVYEEYVHYWNPPSEIEARVRAFESLLVERGYAQHDAIDAMVDAFENDLGPLYGARVVAKAWSDPEFKARLLENTTEVLHELNIPQLQTEHVITVENKPGVHNLVVCTLCSCYPWGLLGLPPHWFKAPQYRSRAVSEPREVLKEFGLELPADTKIQVWDTSAEIRYLVLDERPAGTEGWTEEQLAELVTRDSMIGVGKATAPSTAGV